MDDIKNKDQDGDQFGIKTDTPGSENAKTRTATVSADNPEMTEMNGMETGSSQKEIVNEAVIDQRINAVDTVGVVQSVGHLLRNARLARNMSINEVSRQLCLSAQQIDAIEKEDYEKLPGRIFLRGFVRNYANFVQLDPAPILKLLPQSVPVASVQRTPFQIKEETLPSSGHNRNRNVFLIISVVSFLLLVIGYGIYQTGYWEQKSAQENEMEMALETNIKTDQTTVELQLPLPSAASSSDTLNAVKSTQGAEPVQMKDSGLPSTDSSSAAATNLTPTQNNLGTLHFLFLKESWVQVKESTGKTIFERTNASGTERVVNGKRPLTLVIGNADGVNLTYNDRLIDLKPYAFKNKGIARFTLE